MVLSTVQVLILFSNLSRATVPSDEALADELTRAFLAYLGVADSRERRAK
jgi:hypothetical protein